VKIIQVGNYPVNYSIIKGGVQSSIFGITMELAKNNEVSVISYPKKEIGQDYSMKDDSGVIIHYLKNPYKFHVMSIIRLPKFIAILNKMKGNIVHIHESSIFSLFLILYLVLSKKNFVLTEHGILFVEQWQQFKRKKSMKTFLQLLSYSVIEFLCLNLSKKIIVDTVYVKKRLRNIIFRNLNVIPQGISNVFYTLQDTPNPISLLSIGGISSRKGYEYSIEAINIVKREFPGIRYAIVGTYESENSSYLELLKGKIRTLHLEEIICIETNVSFKYVISLLEKANVFILHSLEESQGIVFCEAMAAGKPVVATNAGGIPYVVQNDVNGKLSNAGDVAAFAANITMILRDNMLRNTISTQNKIAAKRYSWEKIAVEIENLYKK
jgi:glycosyltransferase involved in cell wall biosynthesis